MSTPLPLNAVCRLPAPDDNVAIAIRRLDAGTRIEIDGDVRTLASCVLEGHRLAVRPIAPGEALLSWGLPFGHALVPIAPGDYVCNASILQALAMRQLGVPLPAAPNFEDYLVPFALDPATYRPGQPVERVARPRTFRGYRRAGGRGVGTRNTIVILGTTSRTASVARQLAARLQPLAKSHPRIDGIVAVAHTEGGGPGEPNNTGEVLRALAGFMVHPNVGAILALDLGVEPITNARLQAFMREHGHPLDRRAARLPQRRRRPRRRAGRGRDDRPRLDRGGRGRRPYRGAARRPAHRAAVRRLRRLLRRLRQPARRRRRARADPARRHRRPVRDRRDRRRRGLRAAQHARHRDGARRAAPHRRASRSACPGTASRRRAIRPAATSCAASTTSR